ncbi:hypothetical protein Tco_0803061 [Tanacetum coccineum]|uniref:Uncharacterized protein n=1 Tax=Tanacetum coccineum TaxID=301880 RepID=A0ABQ5A4V1_9ASTR
MAECGISYATSKQWSVLASTKKFTKKNPPDIVIYVDRLDTQTRDHNDSLGLAIWKSVIVTLTHGASAPTEGSNGLTPAVILDVYNNKIFHAVTLPGTNTIVGLDPDLFLHGPVLSHLLALLQAWLRLWNHGDICLSKEPESPLTPSRQMISPTVDFYAGEWEELPGVLSVMKNDIPVVASATTLSFSEEDFMDTYSSHDDVGGGYEIILMIDIPTLATSLKKLYALLKKDEKQIKTWSLPELLLQLSNDSQTINEILKQREEKRIEREQAANLAVQKEQEEQAAQSFTPYWNFPMINDDDEEYTIQYREYLENSSKAIAPVLPIEEPDNSLSMGDEHLSTIPETESDKLIKSSVENLVPIPRESEGIFDNMCDVPSCDKKHFDAESDLMESLLNRDIPIVYSPKIDSLLEKFADELTPINPIPPGIHEADFNPKEDIRLDDQMFYNDTSSDDDSFEDIDYVEASPPDSELVSIEEVENDILRGELSRVVMETIDEIDAFLDIDVSTDLEDGYHDSEGDIIYLESLLINNTIPNFSPEVFFDHEQKCLKDEPNNLISMVKVFDPGIWEIIFSPTYVKLPFEDRHYLSFTYVIRIFLPYFTYPMDSFLPLSSGSEDIIFDPDISVFHFSSLEPVAYECPMEDCPDFKDSRARCFVHRSLALQILSMLILGIRYPNLID